MNREENLHLESMRALGEERKGPHSDISKNKGKDAMRGQRNESGRLKCRLASIAEGLGEGFTDQVSIDPGPKGSCP